MKVLSLSVLALAGIALVSAFTLGGNESIAIGTQVSSDLEMAGTDGKNHTLATLKGENGLAVVFSCNTCPFVVGGKDTEGWEGRYAGVKTAADAQNVGMVLVNSNAAKREKGDSMADMQKRAKEQGFENIAYVLDEASKLADSFGAKTTPHVFLFDKDMKLVYKGAIDDSVESAEAAKEHYLQNAMVKLAAGKKIKPETTRAVGCSIKRVK